MCPSRCLSVMNQKYCIHKIYFQENISDRFLFSAAADMWVYIFSQKDFITDRLLLISCEILSVSLALSVINQFGHGDIILV